MLSTLSQWLRTRRRKQKVASYLSQGSHPWSQGYAEHKVDEIVRSLAQGGFSAESLPLGFGFRLDERIIEYPWLFSRLPKSAGTLLDAGSALNHPFILSQSSLQSKKIHICTLAPETECHWQQGISYLFDDLRNLPYRDELFDWVVCLSTLEHVGMDNTRLYTQNPARRESARHDYLQAVVELHRVLKPGGTLYASIPYGRSADHEWLQVFDASAVDMLVKTFSPQRNQELIFRYHPDGWHTSSRADAFEATYFDVHTSAGAAPDYAAAARAVCCLELQK